MNLNSFLKIEDISETPSDLHSQQYLVIFSQKSCMQTFLKHLIVCKFLSVMLILLKETLPLIFADIARNQSVNLITGL